jgi:O-antigen ligase
MNQRPWFTSALWLLLPTAINAPLLLTPGGSRIFAILLLLCIILINGLIVPGSSVRKSKLLFNTKISEHCAPGPLAAIGAFTCLITICIMRGFGAVYTFSNTIANASIFVLSAIAITLSLIQAETKDNRNQIINCLFFGGPLYVAINLALFALGISNRVEVTEIDPEGRINQTLNLIGITTGRVAFPLAAGINGFGTISAFSLLICTFLGAYGKGISKYIALAFVPMIFIALALTDARGATIAAIATGLSAIWIKRNPKWIKIAYASLLLTPIIPSLAYRFFDFANHSTLFSFAIRSGDLGARLGVGTGRGEIWKSILIFFSDFSPIHIVGYGAHGEATSGISSQYSWIFNEVGPALLHCHNSYLQYLVDMGYIGVAAWLGMLAMIIHSTSKTLQGPDEASSFKLTITSLLLLTITQSQTEVVGTIYTPEMLIFLLTITIASNFHHRIKRSRLDPTP